MTFQINLENMEFFAYHGYYDEEQKIGNRYSVDVRVEAAVGKAAQADDLHHTVNYEQLYRIVSQEMQNKARLLEHFAYKIVLQIFDTFAAVKAVEVVVKKHNPPIGGVCGIAQVKLCMNKEEYFASKQ
jgi:7,8-dihydroneopterin aldolase/epimerase/oxygenase